MTATLSLQLPAAFAAGLLLNFTPCVLPVLPIKIRTLLHEVGGSRRARALAALMLLAGSLVFFITVGALSAGLGWQWGALFQSAEFLAALSLVLFAAGMATWLEMTIPLPQWLYRLPIHRYSGAFVTGLLSGILSTPCAGPFLGSVLAYSLTQPPAVVVALFGALGLGLSCPAVLALAYPGLLKRLSAGGPIGRQVESLLGFILLGGAIFFSQSLLPAPLPSWLGRGLGAAVLLWALRALAVTPGKGVKIVPSLTLVLLLGLGAAALQTPDVAARPVWQPYSDELLTGARQTARPVLIEFTADWCINCKVLERTVYADTTLLDLAADMDLLMLQVDMTDFDENDKQLLDRHGGTALPFAVVIDRRGRPIQTFTGLFTVETLMVSLTAARDG